jgi:hypothetical protein
MPHPPHSSLREIVLCELRLGSLSRFLIASVGHKCLQARAPTQASASGAPPFVSVDGITAPASRFRPPSIQLSSLKRARSKGYHLTPSQRSQTYPPTRSMFLPQTSTLPLILAPLPELGPPESTLSAETLSSYLAAARKRSCRKFNVNLPHHMVRTSSRSGIS